MNLSVDFTTPGFDPASLALVWSARADAEAEAAYVEFLRDMEEPIWGTYGAFEAAWSEDAANYPDDGYWSAVEQGYYDDDPNPYHGDYAEDDGD